jgi:hypothetical protein
VYRGPGKGNIKFHTATPGSVPTEECEAFARRLEALSAPDCSLAIHAQSVASTGILFTLNWSRHPTYGIVYGDRTSSANRFSPDGVLRDFFRLGNHWCTADQLVLPRWHFHTEIALEAVLSNDEYWPGLAAATRIIERLRRVPLPFDTLRVEVRPDGVQFCDHEKKKSGNHVVALDLATCGRTGNRQDSVWTDIASGFYALVNEQPSLRNPYPATRRPHPGAAYAALRPGSVQKEDEALIRTKSLEVPFRVVHSPLFAAPELNPQFGLPALKADLHETRCPSCNAKYTGTHAHFYPCGCSVKITYAQEPWGVHLERIWVASSQGLRAPHPTREGAARALRELLGA